MFALTHQSHARSTLNLVEHAPEQHPLRLAVADLAMTKQMFGAK
jgi:hypothetical protein